VPIPARILRGHAEDLPGGRPHLSAADLDRQDRILATGLSLFARFGRAGITMAVFAAAMRLSPSTVRRHFPDLDALLAHLITRHLLAIAAALGDVPADAPDRSTRLLAAYIAATRTGFGAPTEPHLLLLRERHALPDDLAAPIGQIRGQIGETLAGPNGEAALALLDTPNLHAPQIQAMLAALQATPFHPFLQPATETAPQPATPSAPLRPIRFTPPTAVHLIPGAPRPRPAWPPPAGTRARAGPDPPAADPPAEEDDEFGPPGAWAMAKS
jgi:AcrR family transcriptional regulator